MSIINDALKKTQQRLMKPNFKKNLEKPVEEKQIEQQQAQQKPAEQAQKSSPNITNVYEKMYRNRQQREALSTQDTKQTQKPLKQGSTPRRAKNWFKMCLTAALFAASIFASYSFLSRNKSVQKFFGFTPNAQRSSRHLIAKHVPKKQKYKSGDLVLNGISFIDGKRVALINDEIYEAGAVINNKTITHISPNEVELRDDEKIFTITVR